MPTTNTHPADLPPVTDQERQTVRPIPAPKPNKSAPGAAGVAAPALSDQPAPPADELPPLDQRTLTDIHKRLCAPFPLWAIEVKPGAVTKDKARAMAMAYVDARAYQTRLDRLAGPEGWTVEYRPIGDRAILCRLTILGVAREDVGECDAGDPNQATSATMQAFKRACAAFGMGRYLYNLPKPWVDYDDARRQIKDSAGAAQEIYVLAGLPIQ